MVNEKGKFTVQKLPVDAQLSAINGILVQDFDGDGMKDILLSGNKFDVEVETTPADASPGLFLKGTGDLSFKPLKSFESGFFVPYNVKDMQMIQVKQERAILIDEHFQNRLTKASSPYLREHADNPVDWYEWGSEALEKSKREGKPLIVSVGYASCHWCHVMEKESFMDTAVARLMNENFVSIKVDREERPDIDQIYVNAAQLISGNAGWPLNAFALPDGKPFYVATYFPKDQWLIMLRQILDVYRTKNETVVKQAEALTDGIKSQDLVTTAEAGQVNFNQKFYHAILDSMEVSLDFQLGGLKGSPKFPMPVIWEHLLQNNYLTGNKKALEVVGTTLDEMAKGGIYDHLGGGFARYSTDANWKVPHFEKMLYDNAQLVSLYSHAYQQSNNPTYKAVVHETLEFIKNELTSSEGGFYSSLNADSEGEEGKFYVWRKNEIEIVLDKKRAELFNYYYNVTDSGNWEQGKNILFRKLHPNDVADIYSMSFGQIELELKEARNILLTERNKRIHPSLDDKVLTSWNALMLTGFVDAYVATGEKEYLATAIKNAKFLESKMFRGEGRLWRVYNNNTSSIDAFLDDYSLLARAFIRLYEVTFDVHWIEQARLITDYAILHFYDKEMGLFYFTSDQSEGLVARKVELADHVIPSSNSVVADVLYRLGEYYDENSYRELSQSMVSRMANDVIKNGPFYANWANLIGLVTYQPYEVAIMGSEALTKNISLQHNYLPTAIFMGGNTENLPLLKGKSVKDKTIIYVCRNKVCKLPVGDEAKALEQLK
ncbi:hypothetical protein FGG08_007567 [Glutinoglossum americanum]|uniref:Spermatogenesis-associated protein 20-like TRX domain-containing protein n=1 Tax=Glutinoglossum americanum TaxID=1670608 RepID=A0A9P8HZ60_9PEZI|nr:hypothetical protein FGG08_007567 [Glutinoglossum americanum]